MSNVHTQLPSEALENALPQITVVTVVFNGAQFLEETIQSVINQTYPNVQYIIIDGGSTDGTLEIIRKYESAIDYWVSEKDDGIYDAMNKGILMASGQWINFMNAGDRFYHVDTIRKAFCGNISSVDILYGDVQVDYCRFSRIQKSGRPMRLWMGMQFSHQSAFVNLSRRPFQFNYKNKIAADLEFFYGAYRAGAKFDKVDDIISIVSAGGLSDSNRIPTIVSSLRAVLNNHGSPVVYIFYGMCILNYLIRALMKRVLPAVVVEKIIKTVK